MSSDTPFNNLYFTLWSLHTVWFLPHSPCLQYDLYPKAHTYTQYDLFPQYELYSKVNAQSTISTICTQVPVTQYDLYSPTPPENRRVLTFLRHLLAFIAIQNTLKHHVLSVNCLLSLDRKNIGKLFIRIALFQCVLIWIFILEIIIWRRLLREKAACVW